MTTKEGKHYRTLLSGTAISAVLVASMLLFANSAISQRALAQENQTSQANQTAQQANQTASQANQTGNPQANQTAQQQNQTASQANQTGGGASNKTGGGASNQTSASAIKPGDLKKLSTSLNDVRTDLQKNDVPAALKKLGNADSDLAKLMNKKPSSSSSDKGSSDKDKSKSGD
jgi:type II secretory pathway pseudopilin PulG